MKKDKLRDNLFIYQREDLFRYGIDAVLLAHFSMGLKGKVLDLGTGSGIIPLLLSTSPGIEQLTGLEYQKEALELAKKSVVDNGLTDRVTLVHGDLMKIEEYFEKESFTGLVSNPPYFEKGHGLSCQDLPREISRSEKVMDLEGLIRASSYLLRPKSPINLIYRPRRLAQLISLLTNYGLEPKTLRMVHPRRGKEANLVLLEAIKGGGRQLRILDPLFVYEEGDYSKETLKIYEELRML